MAVEFTEVPSNLRVPFVGIEIDSSDARGLVTQQNVRALVIGQQVAAATQIPNTVERIFNASQASELFGDGSLLHEQFEAWFKNNQFTEVYAGILDDDGGATATTKTITFTGPATENGTLYLYINGVLYQVGVTIGMTATQLATAVKAKLDAASRLPVTTGQALGVATLTTKLKGLASNEIDVRINYLEGQTLPAGLTCVIATGVAGATNPSLDSLIAAIANQRFDIIVCPYTDTASVLALNTELERRGTAMVQMEGFGILAKVGTVGALATWGAAENSQWLSVMGTYHSPTPGYQWSASVGAVVARELGNDPARPFNTLELVGVLPSPIVDQFTMDEQNSLLFDGISTWQADGNAKVRIGRIITTYQRDVHGADDASYLDLNVPLTLAYIRRDLRTYIQSKYPRHKLADDGSRFGAGQAVVTPSVLKCEIVARARVWEELGLVEGVDAFAASLIVERNLGDRNRVDVQMAPNLINQLQVAAVLVKYLL